MISVECRAAFLATVLLLVDSSLGAIGPVTDLYVRNAMLSPDGYSRSTVVADGIFPGPLITGTMGDRFQINVYNELADLNMEQSTTIHWHGLFQAGSASMDGTAFVSQCPIAPRSSFTYDFSAPDQAGTFWYHSHLSTQYCDGLRGPMIIYDPDDPNGDLYDVDDESTVITLADWYHTFAPDVGVGPIANATLINGLGRYPNGPESDLAVISVTYGKRYRFRLINMACDPNYLFSMDGHGMTIIEADGINTEPLAVDSIQIFAGQRYSFILDANQTVGNYWVRAGPKYANRTFDNGLNSAILRYEGAPEAWPTSDQTSSTMPLQEANLHPLEAAGVPGAPEQGGADININLAVTYDQSIEMFRVNGVPFESPTVPVLLQILSGVSNASDLLPSGSVYGLEKNKSVEISIPAGAAGGPHPLHLHGHPFDVIRSAGSDVYNYDNPVRRDVVNLGQAGDNVTIRFTTDNPGPWIMHCHIDWHLREGFGLVFAEGTQDIISHNADPVNAAWEGLCPTYNALPADEQ